MDAQRRGHSAITSPSSFPATLLRLNAGLAFKQFRFERPAQNEYRNAPLNTNVWTNCLPCMLSHGILHGSS